MDFQRGRFVYWSNGTRRGVGRILRTDEANQRVLVQPDGTTIHCWFGMNQVGLRLFPESLDVAPVQWDAIQLPSDLPKGDQC